MNIKHGHNVGGKWSPTYMSWTAMVKRCTNLKHPSSKNYGRLGIKVCKRWRKFENFLEDMGERPKGMSLDRLDNDGDYCPGNCRWASAREQQRNRRDTRKATYRGITLPLVEWAERVGIHHDTLEERLRKKWPIHLVFTLPPSKTNSILRKTRVYPDRDALGRYIRAP